MQHSFKMIDSRAKIGRVNVMREEVDELIF